MKSFLSKIVLALALSSFGVRAAQPASGELEKQVAEAVKTARSQMPAPATTFSIDFPGGTIRHFLNAVSKIDGVSVNIIADEADDLTTPLPAFSLRNTNAQTVLQVLMRLLEARGFSLTPVGMEANSVSAVLARKKPSPPQRSSPSQFESFQLAPYLADQSIDDIVGAIHAAWELDPQHDANALKLKFHPATSILLVSGPGEGLSTAAKIISQLKISPKIPKPAETEKR
jgi:hypothetical protein